MARAITLATDESTWKSEWPFPLGDSENDPDINNERKFVFEFTLAKAYDLWLLLKNGLWQGLVDERFGFYKGSQAWPWAKVYALEILLSAYFIYIRRIKVGVDVDHHGAYFYNFKDGRPLFRADFC